MERRLFLRNLLGVFGAAAVAPEELIWQPTKKFFIPKNPIVAPIGKYYVGLVDYSGRYVVPPVAVDKDQFRFAFDVRESPNEFKTYDGDIMFEPVSSPSGIVTDFKIVDARNPEHIVLKGGVIPNIYLSAASPECVITPCLRSIITSF